MLEMQTDLHLSIEWLLIQRMKQLNPHYYSSFMHKCHRYCDCVSVMQRIALIKLMIIVLTISTCSSKLVVKIV